MSPPPRGTHPLRMRSRSGADSTHPRAVLAIGLPVWGWLHLVLGVLVLATGAGLLRREIPGWARGSGTALVAINVVVQLAWRPASPIWSIIVITLDVVVLYSLFVAWDAVRE